MLGDAITATLGDLLLGLLGVGVFVCGVLGHLVYLEWRYGGEDVQAEAEVVEAFSQFPERWRPEGEARARGEDWGQAA